jgi:hypothetical protein
MAGAYCRHLNLTAAGYGAAVLGVDVADLEQVLPGSAPLPNS